MEDLDPARVASTLALVVGSKHFFEGTPVLGGLVWFGLQLLLKARQNYGLIVLKVDLKLTSREPCVFHLHGRWPINEGWAKLKKRWEMVKWLCHLKAVNQSCSAKDISKLYLEIFSTFWTQSTQQPFHHVRHCLWMKIGGIKETLPHSFQSVQHHASVQSLQPVRQSCEQTSPFSTSDQPAWFSNFCPRVSTSIISQLGLQAILNQNVSQLNHGYWWKLIALPCSVETDLCPSTSGRSPPSPQTGPTDPDKKLFSSVKIFTSNDTLMSDTMVRSVLSITKSFSSLVNAWW